MDYFVLGLVAGLAAVERKGFLQAMLSRPIALAPITGLALGDLRAGLLLGPPLELFWLGAVTLGASRPMHEAIGTAAITGAAILAARGAGLAGVSPAVALLSVVLLTPIGILGRRAEWVTERVNLKIARRAAERIEKGDAGRAVRLNLLGLTVPFTLAGILAPLGAAAAALVISELYRFVPALAEGRPLSRALATGWVAFSALACVAGARALHSRRAPALFAAAALVGVLIFTVGGWRP